MVSYRNSSILFVILSCVFGSNAEAGGKKSPQIPSCGPSGTPVYTTPNPIRAVVVNPIGSQAFPLPNGQTADISLELQSILTTAVTGTHLFQPISASQTDPCVPHLELTATVDVFQLNVASMDITFGFTGTQISSGFESASGSLNVNVGTISMSFALSRCEAEVCQEIDVSRADQTTAGVNLAMTIDFTVVQTGASFILNTPIGNDMINIMNNGMSILAKSQNLPQAPWQATVTGYAPEVGLLTFNAGADSGVAVNQEFEIYDPTSSTSNGICKIYQTIAYAHTTRVDQEMSTALVDQTFNTFDPSSIQVGDLVMIHTVGK